MRPGFSTVRWLLIIALAAQGVVPGAVVCFESTGQVEFETAGDICCAGDTHPFGNAGFSASTASRAPGSPDSCGPCTDSFISPIAVTKPAGNGDVSINLPRAHVAFDPPAIAARVHATARFVATDATLTSLKTKILLV
jgi:hypothetical protein